MYNFKEIKTIPNAKNLIDIVLSETQRHTPTQVHPQFKISRIRNFYMRKVKYCQQAYHNRLQNIVKQFPRIDDIHPFYGHLCNVLYDRDHYKLALGQVDAIRRVIDSISKDYVRLLKYSDSPYKCKMVKRAALGRMSTAIKKLQNALSYLEEVRQHLSRLPSINPNTRTLILTGFPNVGKSSFMNLVTNANVDVQPYAFTTQSLFVGHFDYAYIRWQLLDTPGILDQPLHNRNPIELTAITALAYLQACILYVVDISEECGFTIEAQVSLFKNIKALFQGKPIVILYNKTDRRKFEELDATKQQMLNEMSGILTDQTDKIAVLQCSCLNATGVDNAKNKACEMLLEQRVENKINSSRIALIENRLNIIDRTTIPRPPCIPESVIQQKLMKEKKENDRILSEEVILTKDMEELFGGPGVYSIDINSEWKVKDESWTHDAMPELFCGQNVMDFIDPEIEEKLKELEKEEIDAIQEESENLEGKMIREDWTETSKNLDKLIRKIRVRRIENNLRKNRTRVAQLPRTNKLVSQEQVNKVPIENLRLPKKKPRHIMKDLNEDVEMTDKSLVKIKNKTISKKPITYTKNTQIIEAVQKHHQLAAEHGKVSRQVAIAHYRQHMGFGKNKGRAGDADRFIGTKLPRHLFASKRGIGKLSRR